MEYIPLNLYSTYDKLTKRYAVPFTSENDDSALRAFELGFKDYPHVNKDDYSLYRIGTFNVYNGVVVGSDPEEVVAHV